MLTETIWSKNIVCILKTRLIFKDLLP